MDEPKLLNPLFFVAIVFVFFRSPTSVAEVVDEDDLFQQDGRSGLQDAVYGPQQGGPGLVVEGDDHGRGGEAAVVKRLASASKARGYEGRKETNI